MGGPDSSTGNLREEKEMSSGYAIEMFETNEIGK